MSVRCYRRDGTPYDDVMDWAREIETSDRVVRQQRLANGIWVSTVHLGLDHNFHFSGPPLIFETMTFKKDDADYDQVQERYATEAEAIAGHERIVKEQA